MFGAGSWSSPIVISDDEDEAYVERELELEQRLSSPRGRYVEYYNNFEYVDEYEDDLVDRRLWGTSRPAYYEGTPEEDMLYGTVSTLSPFYRVMEESRAGYEASISAGSKRKRPVGDASFDSPPRTLPPPPAVSLTIPGGVQLPPASKREAKNKKKKRKREEAERLRTAGLHGPPHLGPSTSRKAGPSYVVPPLHPPPLAISNSYSSIPHMPYSQPTSFPLPLKPLFMTPQLTTPLPPPIPLRHQSSTTSLQPTIPPSTARYNHLTPAYTRTGPLPPPPGPPIPPAPLVKQHHPPPQPKGIIGRPRREDPNAQHGSYPAELKEPLPEPRRTLIMDPLPKKYRNASFVRWWAMRFGPQDAVTLRIEVDGGKALVEFATPDVARAAFNSPRIYGEGKEHIRVWWYRADLELEEGEIDEEDDFPLLPVPSTLPNASGIHPSFPAQDIMHPSTSKPALSLAIPRPSTPVEDHPSRQFPAPVMPSKMTLPQPSTVPAPIKQSTSTSVPTDIDSGASDSFMRGLQAAGELLNEVHDEMISLASSTRNSAITVEPMDVRTTVSETVARSVLHERAPVSMDVVQSAVDAPSPTSTEASTAVASSSVTDQSPSPTLGSPKATPTPPLNDLHVPKVSSKRNDELTKLLARKQELEEKIAHSQAKLRKAPEKTDAVPNKPTKAEDLRKLVLESKKARTVTIVSADTRSDIIVAATMPPGQNVVTSGPDAGQVAFSLASAHSDNADLGDLALSFIAESIKTVSPLLPPIPPPTSLTPPSPEPISMSSSSTPEPQPMVPLAETKATWLLKEANDDRECLKKLEGCKDRKERMRLLSALRKRQDTVEARW
ncbi:hypothetical protein EIP86_006807 [Pleurotus ostreatoroseus]|nr:hypothetical protein EIP86_006807 [Pleurotus ostreatoroseus]